MIASMADKPVSAACGVQSGEGVKVGKIITINRPISEIYSFWRKVENLPLFMSHLVSVMPVMAV